MLKFTLSNNNDLGSQDEMAPHQSPHKPVTLVVETNDIGNIQQQDHNAIPDV